MSWTILSPANAERGPLFIGDEPKALVNMLWHHSKAHVSRELFKRSIVNNDLCELIRSGAPESLYDDFNLILGKLTGAYRDELRREPCFQEIVALVSCVVDTESTAEYDQKAEAFFDFWREWRRIQAPTPEHPECFVGVTVVELAMKLWNNVKDDLDEDTFRDAMADDQAALESLGREREDIVETAGKIERHYQEDLHRKPFARELKYIAAEAVGRVADDKEEDEAVTQKILDQMELDRIVMNLPSEDDDEEAED